MSAMQRNKGSRGEREVVNRLKAAGIHAERVALSGAMKGKRMGEGHDVDFYPACRGGKEGAPLCGEVKLGQHVPKTIINWLADNDALVFRRDNGEWVYVFPERIAIELMRGGKA